MKENRLKYEQPIIDVINFHEYAIFTLTVSTEYDTSTETDTPSIDDIIRSQYW